MNNKRKIERHGSVNMRNVLKEKRGITLIALVITIIVLLILAGVSINAVIGENGIASKAKESKTATIVAEEEELVNLAYSGAYANNEGETVTLDDMKESLEGLKADVTVEDNGDGTLKIIFTETKNEYTVDINEDSNSIDWDTIVANIPIKYEEYLEQAEEKGQETSEINIGIGTDGEVVNLSLWNYFKTDDGKGMSLGKGETSEGTPGYNVDALKSDGKIQGKIPQYIYIQSENKVYPVTVLESTFSANSSDFNSSVFSTVNDFPEIPPTITNIGASVFYGCTGLTSVIIPDSVISIGNLAFGECTGLTSVIIPDSVTSIGVQAFGECTGLTSVIIPDNVTSIGSYAFYGCTSLTDVTIPSSVISIGGNAFYNVPHISYSGTATGSPWGAKSIN